jgi:hypothetical protein
MNISVAEYFEKMVKIIAKKKELLKEMLVLTDGQTAAIKSEALDALNKLIEEKQLRIDIIDKLDSEFTTYFEGLKSAAKVKSLDEINSAAYPEAKQLKEETYEVMSLVKRISEIEELNSKASKELLDKLGSEIKRVNQGKRINQAYNPNSPDVPSFFIDNKK